jgi:hypothetical protein
MLAKLTALLHSKIALAIIGATLVAGTGAAVASAATGQSPTSVLAFANRQFLGQSTGTHDTSGDDEGDACDSQHQHVSGAITHLDAAGMSFTLSVTHHADDSGAADTHEGTPTAKTTPTVTTTTHTVKVTAQTTYTGAATSFGALTVGMAAEVHGAKQSDGSLLASTVFTKSSAATGEQAASQGDQTDECDGEHEQTHGVVASVNSAGSSFTLTVKHEADDASDGHSGSGEASDEHGTPTAHPAAKPTPTTFTLTVNVTAQTRFEGVTKTFAGLKVGMQAEVGGTPQSKGVILASTVNTGSSDQQEGSGGTDHSATYIYGVVVTVSATSLTVKDAKGAMTTVTVSNTTTYVGVKGIADLKAGMHVVVVGMKQSNGSIAAQHILAGGSGGAGE